MRPSSLYRGVASSAAGTGFSRVLGAARDIVLARILGANAASDAFWVAFSVPTVFRRFVADEGLTGVMVPALSEAERDENPEAARRISGGIFTALVTACALLCALGMLGSEWLVLAFASGFLDDPAQFALTVQLTRWLFPFILFVSLVSWCEGLLNLRGHYFIPKAAPGLVSAGLILAGLLATDQATLPFALVAGALGGALAHFLVCLPAVLRLWGPVAPNLSTWRTARFRRILNEMGKVVAIGVFAQLNLLALRQIGSYLPAGSITHYWYANRVVDLAQGVIAVAVGSALLPPISRAAAAGDWTCFDETLADAIRLAAVILLPAAALLVAIPGPIVSTLFLHGQFSAEAAEVTAQCLRLMVPFMLGVAGINILKKPYFALERRDILLRVGALGLLLTIGLGWSFSLPLGQGVDGLAMALSISTIVQLMAYALLLQRQAGPRLRFRPLASPVARMAFASVPAAAAAWATCRLGHWESGAGLANAGILAAAVITAAAVYLAGAWTLGVRQEIRRVVQRGA